MIGPKVNGYALEKPKNHPPGDPSHKIPFDLRRKNGRINQRTDPSEINALPDLRAPITFVMQPNELPEILTSKH